jgi:hypothetical protein
MTNGDARRANAIYERGFPCHSPEQVLVHMPPAVLSKLATPAGPVPASFPRSDRGCGDIRAGPQ